MNRWEQGRIVIDALISAGDLQRVAANREWATTLIGLADEQIKAAKVVLDVSPLTSFQTSYDAMHKLFDAVLVNQGLRGTHNGGHLALQRAIKAQLVPPLGDLIDDFDWMRRLRNAGDYPVPEKPMADAEDAEEALAIVSGFLAKAKKLIDSMPVYGS